MSDKRGNRKRELRKFKSPDVYRGNSSVKLTSSVGAQQIDYPIFSFKHIVGGYGVDCCNKQEKCDLLGKLNVMSQKTWGELMRGSHESGAGFEKIPKNQIKSSLPGLITEDVSELYSIRFNSLSSRLIGHKSDHIFHITHIDVKLKAYEH